MNKAQMWSAWKLLQYKKYSKSLHKLTTVLVQTN